MKAHAGSANRRLLFCSYHCGIDPSSGAALATRDLLELLAARGWACGVFSGPRMDFETAPPLEQLLRSLGLPFEVRDAPAGVAPFRLFHVPIHGVPTLASRRGALPETLAEAGFLFDVPARCTPEVRLAPTAEEAAPWLETLIRLWDDADFYEAERRRCLAAAEAWRPERLLPRYSGSFSYTQLFTRLLPEGAVQSCEVEASRRVVAGAAFLSKRCPLRDVRSRSAPSGIFAPLPPERPPPRNAPAVRRREASA